MKKLVLINSSCGVGSTGKICTSIAEEYEEKGWEARVAYGRVDYVPDEYKKYAIRIGSRIDTIAHAIYTRITDKHGFSSRRATKIFLKWLSDYQPDLLWLHNIHGYYINIEMLFDWIKKQKNLEVKWTLHDCWTFTGHCAHFTMVKCGRWRNGCYNCMQKRCYPASFLFDKCNWNYKEKKRIFCGVKNMSLITPSEWLANLVKQSFLRDYPVSVAYNTINREIFRPIQSDIKERLNIADKFLILGVAYIWDKRKGYDDLLALSEMLDERFRLVLVGLTEKQTKDLPSNVIAIKRTTDQEELAKIYSAADFFVNPSVEETFGMTTVEAIACGTQAIVYSDTACEEIAQKYGGIVVQNGNVRAIYEHIMKCVGENHE